MIVSGKIVLCGEVYEIVRDQRDDARRVVKLAMDDAFTRPSLSVTPDEAHSLRVGERVVVTVETARTVETPR